MALKLVFLESSVEDPKARIKSLDTTTSGGHDWFETSNPFYYSVVFSHDGRIFTHGIEFSCVDHFSGLNGIPVASTTTVNDVTTTNISWKSLNNTNNNLSSTSESLVTEKIIKAAIDNAVNNAIASSFVYKGTYTASSATTLAVGNFQTVDSFTSIKKGWTWKVVGVSGSNNHFGTQVVENGDTIIALEDEASTEALFNVIQTNIDFEGLKSNTLSINVGGTSFITYNPFLASNYINFAAGTNVTLTPSGNTMTIAATDTNTWRTLKYYNGTSNVEMLGSSIETGALTFKGGDNVSLAYDSTNKVLTFSSSYVNTWRPVNAYKISAASPTGVLGGGISTNPLNFGSEFAYDEGDSNMTGDELHLVWAEVSSNGITYHV